MNNPLISIIVPVYNTSRYLEECVRSLLVQTYRDYEIILINDGSTDESGDICDRFTNENPTHVKVIHQKNLGVSAARNIGVKEASGEWITFVDSDDWVEANMLEVLIKEAQSAKCDLCICGYISEYPNRSVRNEFNLLSGYQLTKADKLILFKQNFETRGVGNFQENIFIVYLWAKLYQKKLLVDNDITFNSDISVAIGEDTMFNTYAIELSKKTIFIKDALYHYRIHSSQSTKTYQAKAIESTVEHLQELLVFTNRFYLEKEAALIYYNRAVTRLFRLIYLKYIVQNTPYTLRQRLLGIKAVINKEPFNQAVRDASLQSFSRKKQIQLWFLRHMPVSSYYYGIKVIDRWRRRE